MASGPDPNRFDPTDPEASAETHRRGEGPGDLSSTRLGLPSWAIVVVALAIFGFLLYLVLRGGAPVA